METTCCAMGRARRASEASGESVMRHGWIPGPHWGLGGIGLVTWPEIEGEGTSDIVVPVLNVGLP